MAHTTPVYARIDTKLKEHAESILEKLGISPSSLIQMVYSQVVLKQGVPFDLTLSSQKPIAMGSLTREQLHSELEKGMNSLAAGRFYTSDEVDALFE